MEGKVAVGSIVLFWILLALASCVIATPIRQQQTELANEEITVLVDGSHGKILVYKTQMLYKNVSLEQESHEFAIKLVSVSEETKNVALFEHPLAEFVVTPAQHRLFQGIKTSFASMKALIGNKSTFEIGLHLFAEDGKYSVADEIFIARKNTLKIIVSIFSWPFRDRSNSLSFLMKLEAKNHQAMEKIEIRSNNIHGQDNKDRRLDMIVFSDGSHVQFAQKYQFDGDNDQESNFKDLSLTHDVNSGISINVLYHFEHFDYFAISDAHFAVATTKDLSARSPKAYESGGQQRSFTQRDLKHQREDDEDNSMEPDLDSEEMGEGAAAASNSFAPSLFLFSVFLLLFIYEWAQ